MDSNYPLTNGINVKMAIMLAWSVVDKVFEPLSSQTKDYEIGICTLLKIYGKEVAGQWFSMCFPFASTDKINWIADESGIKKDLNHKLTQIGK